MSSDLLTIEPPELRFPIELGKQITSSLQFINVTQSDVAFKIKTTNPKNYCVRPNVGTVAPGDTRVITVTMRALHERPLDMQSKDKFLVQIVIAKHGPQEDGALQELFLNTPGNEVDEVRLKVVYVQPTPISANKTEAISREPREAENLFDNSWNMQESEKKDGKPAEQKRGSGFSLLFVLGFAVMGILVGFLLRGQLYV